MDRLKPFDEVKQKVYGGIGAWGPKKVECRCGSKVRFQAKVNDMMLCKRCYEEVRKEGVVIRWS